MLAVAIVACEFVQVSARAGAAERVDFSRDILPILAGNCFVCHGPDAEARKAGLRLDLKDGALRSKDPVIVPGKAEESALVARVTSTDPDEVMPPRKSGKVLSPGQVDLLKRWVEQGAKWGGHWAFDPPRDHPVPEVKDPAWCRNPIDRFVRSRLDAEGLAPAPEADRRTLIRRLTLDLTGLPPTPAEVDAFVADPASDAYDRLADRLLASPRYGERMAMEWLDNARFADTNGYQNDFARTMWPWRDWLIRALNRNLPFDRFTIEQLAGDLLPGATLDQRVATGFNRNNRTVTEAGSIEEEWRIENAVDRVETTSQVFLGLTLGCARCHDHKYDPISHDEFYRFLAFFNSVNEKGVYTEQRGNVPPLVAVPGPREEAARRRLEAAIAAADRLVRDQEAALPARQQAWEAAHRKGPVPAEPRDWGLRAELAGDLVISGPGGTLGAAKDRAAGLLAWTDGPAGKALAFQGRDDAFVEVGPEPGLERGDHFSYGAWVRPQGDGAILSKMDDAALYRGFDLLVTGGKVAAHLVHAWPADAIKVTTRAAIPADAWTHVLLTYDGSGKAAGVTISFDGRSVPLDVQGETLRGSLATDQPLRIGKRSTSLPFRGAVADVRFYRRTLTPDEVRAVADHGVLEIARAEPGERTPEQKALLARAYRARFAAEARSAAEALAKLRAEKEALERDIPTVMVMEDSATPRETFVLKRGRYDMPDPTRKVGPGVPARLPDLPSDAPRNRLGLARWLVSPENPLTARVTANRLWQHHFGAGLVKTAENFGVQGEPPTHPGLLDWLALELVRDGWDVKAMHRRIVTSATYRQASRAGASAIARDPENRLFARGPRFRLAAEVVRDNALAIAGLLVETIGGPSIRPYQPAGLWEELAGGAGEAPYVQDKGANLYRRSLYIYRKRTVPYPGMATFDAPSREVCQVKRPRTNTPLQALELLNDVTYVEAARQLAQRMLTEGGASAEGRLSRGFRLALGRDPRPAERDVLGRGLERQLRGFRGDADAASRFVKHGESRPAQGLDPAELAAYTAVAGVILNLDETISLE